MTTTPELLEEHYARGRRMAWRSLLGTACRELGYDDLEVQHASWIQEREDVTLILRQLCEKYGDLEWNTNLHLGDVIEKHLFRPMRRDGTIPE